MALSSLTDLLVAPKQVGMWQKAVTAGTASVYLAHWLSGTVPGPPSAPTPGVAGAALTQADPGALLSFVNPASGLTYLSGATLSQAFTNDMAVIFLYDRLWHNSGLSATLTTSQTVNSVALPSRCPVKSDPTGRTFNTNGHGVEAWVETYTVMGAGTVAPTISYTDEAGNAGATATAQGWVTGAIVGRSFPFDLAAGDTGVRSIQSYQQTATQTSGTFGLVLRRRLATFVLPLARNTVTVDWPTLMSAVPNDACLEAIYISSSSIATNMGGVLTLAQG